MDFISDNRIVAFCDRGLHIFAVFPSQNDVQHAIILRHTIPLFNPSYFSPLCQTPYHTFKIVVFGDGELRGVEIPASDPSATVITKLGHQEHRWEMGARVAVGLSASVVMQRDGTADLLSYSWGTGEDITFDRTSCSVGLHRLEAVVLSGDLARFVVNGRESTNLIDLRSGETPL